MSHRPTAVRASDAEREDVARPLGEHAAAGRLTPEELDERLDAAYGARTQGELDAPARGPAGRARAAGGGSRARRRAREAGSPRRGGGDRLAAVRRDLGRGRRERLVLADLGHPRRRRRPGARGLAHARPGRSADRRGARRAAAAGADAALRAARYAPRCAARTASPRGREAAGGSGRASSSSGVRLVPRRVSQVLRRCRRRPRSECETRLRPRACPEMPRAGLARAPPARPGHRHFPSLDAAVSAAQHPRTTRGRRAH